MSDTATDDQLFALFDDPNELTRLRAGLELMERDVLERLVAALDDERPRVRATAAYTLGRMASAVQSLQSDLDSGEVETEDLEPIERARIEQVPPTLRRVHALWENDADLDVQAAAFKAMFFYDEVQRQPDRFRGVAEAGLDSPSDEVRRAAAHALHRFDPTSARAAAGLARLLTEPEKNGSNAWQEAAMKLERMGRHAAPALPALAALLDQDIDEDLRESVLDAIRAIDTPESRRVLDDVD